MNITIWLIIREYFSLEHVEAINSKEEKKLKFADINKEYGYQNYEDDDEGKHLLTLSYSE